MSKRIFWLLVAKINYHKANFFKNQKINFGGEKNLISSPRTYKVNGSRRETCFKERNMRSKIDKSAEELIKHLVPLILENYNEAFSKVGKMSVARS